MRRPLWRRAGRGAPFVPVPRVEMVGGALLLTPRPDVVHQRAAHRLAVLLAPPPTASRCYSR
nr:hypothetical protein [Streptomyces sp. Alain-F2R5]